MENLEKEPKDKLNYFQVLDDNSVCVTDTSGNISTTVSSEIYYRDTKVKEDDEVRTIKINKKELLDKLGLISISVDKDEEIELSVTVVGREYTI